VFTVDVTAAVPLARVELRLRFPDSLGPLIVDVPTTLAAGSGTLRYELDLAGVGHVVPNTRIEATWAAFTAPDAEPVTSRVESIRYRDTAHDWRSVEGDLMRSTGTRAEAFAASAGIGEGRGERGAARRDRDRADRLLYL
jgi:hypothetical protein